MGLKSPGLFRSQAYERQEQVVRQQADALSKEYAKLIKLYNDERTPARTKLVIQQALETMLANTPDVLLKAAAVLERLQPEAAVKSCSPQIAN